jgi:hypothetical protein
MHAPQGFGRVDFAALAASLQLREGTRMVIELKSNFLAHAEQQTLAASQSFANAVNEALS